MYAVLLVTALVGTCPAMVHDPLPAFQGVFQASSVMPLTADGQPALGPGANPPLAGHAWRWIALTDGRRFYQQGDCGCQGLCGYLWNEVDGWNYEHVNAGLLPRPRKLILTDWSIPSCGPCRLMRPWLETLYREGYPIEFADGAQRSEIADGWRITSYPTLILHDDGVEVSRIVGLTTEAVVRKWLTDHDVPRVVRAVQAAPQVRAVPQVQAMPQVQAAPMYYAPQAFSSYGSAGSSCGPGGCPGGRCGR
jgi:thiol-disulfide isomerase/thioredoxin